MIKQDLLKLIIEFEKETWKYKESEELIRDMEEIYMIERTIKKDENIDIKKVYHKLLAVMETIRFKYGYESMIINCIPSLNSLKEKLNNIKLDSETLTPDIQNIRIMYDNYIKNSSDFDYLHIKRNTSNEGIYLAFESLKSLITNKEYRKFIDEDQIKEILIDCMKMINGDSSLTKIENKYKSIIQAVWTKSLTNDNDSFQVLFSNITGPISAQAQNLLNRPSQSSCSMISSHFIGTYCGEHRRIGFIYPHDSNIIMASAYDLGSNVFGLGAKNKEKGTSLVTPAVLEKLGIERTQAIGEDVLSSSCYNEVLVDSKPCGLMFIGFGEDDLNIDYEETLKLAKELNLPLYKIDVLNYKNELSDSDKEYIAYHSVISFLDIEEQRMKQIIENNEFDKIAKLITNNKDIIAKKFIELKQNGMLNKHNMIQALSEIESLQNLISDNNHRK